MRKIYDSTLKILNSVSDFVNPQVRPSTLFVKDKLNTGGLLVAEIGVDLGFNALSMLRNLNIRRLYLVDPYDGYCDGNYIFSKNSDHFLKAKNLLKTYRDRVFFVRKYSHDALVDAPDGLDFVYIDGDHSESAVAMDMRDYYPKLNIGGVLGGHDFVGNYLGVCKAVMGFSNELGLDLHCRDMDWWMLKKK